VKPEASQDDVAADESESLYEEFGRFVVRLVGPVMPCAARRNC